MKKPVKTGVAALQQTKSLNSRVITLLHGLVAAAKHRGHHADGRDLTRVIKKLAVEQREVKEEVRASRTTKRTYKKHPKTRSQARGGIVVGGYGQNTAGS